MTRRDIRISKLFLIFISIFVFTSSISGAMAVDRYIGETSCRTSSSISLNTFVFPYVRASGNYVQDDIQQLLNLWAKAGDPDPVIVNRLIAKVDITSKAAEEALLAKIAAAGAETPGGASAFTQKVLDTLDRRRFSKVDAAIQEVMDVYGHELEAVIRTGSSGGRHLQLKVGQEASGYRIFFSDDDVSFVGRRATEASRMLNDILQREGLGKLKVKGFDLLALKNVRGIDLTALNMLDPEKFLGEAGMAGIKGEMLTKGAVVAQKSGEAMSMTAQPLRQFVEAKKSQMLAELLDDNAVKAAVDRFGSLTVVGSCERQIVSAHGGWEKLPDPEKVKYVLRQRLALTESGALRNLAGEGGSFSQATLTKLRELKAKPNLTAEELSWIAGLRAQNLDLAFKEIPHKLAPIIDAAENTGRSLASNPQARKMMDELTTGFALLRDQIIDLPDAEVLAKLKSLAGENKELYSMLYTSFNQSKDLVQMLDQWVASGGTREAFLDMLLKAENRLARLQQVMARKAKKLKAPEAKTLTALEEMLGTDLGDNFVMKMIRHPSAKKVVLTALVATGGAVAIKAMYNSWMAGKFQDDLSGAAFGLMEFVPGGIGVKRALIEGMDTTTTLLFIKDALYLTPAWPIVLAGDLLYIAVDLGTMYRIQMQQAGLVDILVYNGEYDLTGDQAKFIKLVLPDGSAWGPDGIDEWLFQTRAVRVKHSIEGLEYRVFDIAEVSNDLLDKAFIPEDPVTQQLRLAAEQQLNAINEAEFRDAKMNEESFRETVAWARWVFGFETVCANSPERWCKVFDLLKKKIGERREYVKEKIMVPQLIEMAEIKRTQLSAATTTEAKLDKLQEQIEQVRGSSLGIKLSEKIKEQAEKLANEVLSDTAEERTLKRGKHWLAAYAAYSAIWKWGKDIPKKIEERTGWNGAKVFQFKWTGDLEDDERRAGQSRAGFASELSKISRDIRRIKGSEPNPSDAIDKEAFAILSSVVFPWRVVLDEGDLEQPDSGSPYFDDYESAIQKVKELYAGSAEFQSMLTKGAEIAKGGEWLILDRGTSFELKFRDPALAKMYSDGQLSISWMATSNGDFSPSEKGIRTNFAPFSPEPATITVLVERRGVTKAKGLLEVTMQVMVPEDFLALEITPTQPKPDGFVRVEATVPERFFGGRPRFVYKWSCANCRIEDFDRSSTTVTAPKTGSASITCELGVEGQDGKLSRLMRKTLQFSVSDKPTPTPTPTPSPSPSVSPTRTPSPTPSPSASPILKPTVSPTPASSPTPKPPTVDEEREKKGRYMNCLCRCSSGWAGHIGVWWDPEGKSIPECKSSGPCFGGAGAFGCTSRHYIGAPNECSKGCYESVYGKGTYNEKDADKMRREENRKYAEPLKLKLDKDKCPITAQFGDTINFTASVEGGIPPHNFTWTSNGSAKGNTFVFADTRKPGRQTISVTVTDDDGKSATQRCDVVVEAMTVKIELLDKESRIPFGTNRGFKATVMSGSQPARGSFHFQWQPHPEIPFSPFENDGGSTATTRAAFNRLGTTNVWVTALMKEGEKLTTIGESEQVAIEVVQPKLTLTVTPEKPIVGSEVKAKIQAEVPDPKEVDFRWVTSSNARVLGESQDASEITFSPQDTKPITITVNARVPGTGDDLGQQTATVTAVPVDVKVSVLGTEGPKPQIWKEGVGLVTVEKEIVVHQNVNLRADVTPAVDGMRYQWTVNEDSHIVGSDISQAIRANRSQTGTCEAQVIVKNKDGIEIGRGSGLFSVSISQSDLDKAKTMGNTAGRLAEAKALVTKGQLDEGITLIDEVVTAAPTNAEAKNLSAKWKRERSTVQTQLEKVRSAMDQQRYQDAEKELAPAKNLHALYAPVVTIEKELKDRSADQAKEIQAGIAAIAAANDRRDFKGALRLSAEMRTKFKLTLAAEQAVKNHEDAARRSEAEKDRVRGILKQGEAKYNAGDYDSALSDFAQLTAGLATYWNPEVDPEPRYYENLKNEAQRRKDRIDQLLPQIAKAAEDPQFDRRNLEAALSMADEVLQITPGNQKVQGYRSTIADRLARGEKGAKAEDAIKRGEQFGNDRKWPEAVKAFDEAIKADPRNAEAHRLRGRAKREAGDLKGSLDDFDKAIALDPNNYQSQLGRGLTKHRLNDTAGAMADFNRGIQLNPGYAGGYTYRARLKLDTKDHQGAVEDYDRALAIDPKNVSSYINRGLSKANLGDNEGAIADYTKAISLDPNSAIAFNNRGSAKQRLGDLAGAKADYERALGIDATYKTAQNNLAKVNEQLVNGQRISPPPPPTVGQQYYPVDLTSVGGKKGAVKKANGIEYDDASWIRFKSTDERRLSLTIPVPRIRASGIAVISNLDDGHYLDQGKTIANITVVTTAGRYPFAIKAGIHSADWGGPDSRHQRDIPTAISKNPFEYMAVFQLPRAEEVTGIVIDYVETNAPRWVGHAPGFVLKGITMIGTGTTQAETVLAATGFFPLDLTSAGGKKGNVRKAKNIDIDDASWIRLKSTDENRSTLQVVPAKAFTATQVAVVTNLDDATYLEQGATIAMMFVTTDTGTKSYRIQAGVHSSEWNYGVGPKHKRVDNLDIGDNRFLAVFDLGGPTMVRDIRFEYVETNAPKWAGHAPGFVLRGVTLIGQGSSRPIQIDGQIPKVTPTPAPVSTTSAEVEIFNNGNIAGVYNQPTAPTVFTISRPHQVTHIMTYHWNNARGTARPGTIALRGNDGKTHGPWQAAGSPGQGGVVNAYWTVKPNVTIPAGTYTIIDSDPASWAQNGGSAGRGHAQVKGRQVPTTQAPSASPSTTVRAPTTTPSTGTSGKYVIAIFENRSNLPVHILGEEGMFGPENRLAPGEKREVRLKMTPNGRMQFIAGRDGKIIATSKYWNGDPDDLNRFPRVVFDGKALLITTGLR